jgi:hypothetical protein
MQKVNGQKRGFNEDSKHGHDRLKYKAADS